MARVALIGLDENTASVLTDCFHQFRIATTALRIDEVDRLSTEKFDACALRLNDSAESVLEIARNAPANFRMIVYGLASTTAQALRLSHFGINAILDDPIEKRAALRAVRATHLLVVHEFRRYVRIPLVTPVTLTFEGRKLEGQMVEVSGGGISMEVSSLPMHAAVEVVFALPKSQEVRIKGTVRWAREGLLGVRFDEGEPHRQQVKDWIDHYLGIE
jgi:hypothetical protein